MSEHKMHLSFPSNKVAKRLGVSRNHTLRVWCECQSDQVSDPGTYAGQHFTVQHERTRAMAATDPRRLGGWDHIGLVDSRVPNSALNLWKEHVAKCESA
jgi:hypothetical protein